MSRPAWPHPGAPVELVTRAERARVLAAVARDVRDLDVAEDAVQEALLAAHRDWPARGVPAAPGAWLTTVARRAAWKMVGRDRQTPVPDDTLALLTEHDDGARAAGHGDPATRVAADFPDARLELLFACCHPALDPEAQVALTLRAAGGLTTSEIAAAFLVAEPAMGQRLSRATRKLRDSGIPFAVPPPGRLPERLAGVLSVIYLVFNEGYASVAGDARIRQDLCEQAIGLSRVVAALLPTEPEALGLCALLLAHDARRPARLDGDGRTIPLDEQDRSRYDRARLGEAQRLLDRALGLGAPGPYQAQAAIAVLHSSAPTAQETDWPQIAALYDALAARADSPVVALNRAVAIGMARGPDAGLAELDALAARDDRRLRDHHLLPAARAELLRRAGRAEEAAAEYRRALALLPPGGAARRDLSARLDGLAG